MSASSFGPRDSRHTEPIVGGPNDSAGADSEAASALVARIPIRISETSFSGPRVQQPTTSDTARSHYDREINTERLDEAGRHGDPPSGNRGGDILLADSTIFSTLFGGDESLERLWKNIVTV